MFVQNRYLQPFYKYWENNYFCKIYRYININIISHNIFYEWKIDTEIWNTYFTYSLSNAFCQNVQRNFIVKYICNLYAI